MHAALVLSGTFEEFQQFHEQLVIAEGLLVDVSKDFTVEFPQVIALLKNVREHCEHLTREKTKVTS